MAELEWDHIPDYINGDEGITSEGFESILTSLLIDEALDKNKPPTIFSVQTNYGWDMLAFLCDRKGDVVRYIITPSSETFTEKIIEWEATLLQAFHQQWLWVVDVVERKSSGLVFSDVTASWKINFEDIPEKHLPSPNALLDDDHYD